MKKTIISLNKSNKLQFLEALTEIGVEEFNVSSTETTVTFTFKIDVDKLFDLGRLFEKKLAF